MKNEKKIRILSNKKKLWIPVQDGREFTDFFERIKKDIHENQIEEIKKDAISIMSNCIQPNFKNDLNKKRTILVLGRVQSGKTISFMSVMSLARDNKYPIIISLLGTKKNLHTQNENRIRDYVTGNKTRYRFILLSTKDQIKNKEKDIEDNLKKWTEYYNKKRDAEPETIIISALKNSTHINNIIKIFQNLKQKKILDNLTALIFDDESDQASLNCHVKKEKESPIYKQIQKMSNLFDRRTILQYTATPQSLILIDVEDFLSPSHVLQIKPGDSYIGNKQLFYPNSKYIEEINDIKGKGADANQCPDSLKRALKFFLLGVAYGYYKKEDKNEKETKNRSMMIHPSFKNNEQKNFKTWTSKIISQWKNLDEKDLKDKFRKEYEELKKVRTIPLGDLLKPLRRSIRDTRVTMINQESTWSNDDWQQHYSHILVGGNKLDRGFTVEGLTVTYMSRTNKGVKQIDTLQQRARFFGYKKEYIDLCKVFLKKDVRKVFEDYSFHEDNLRTRLEEKEGQDLKSIFEREMLIPENCKPTRSNVLKTQYTIKKIDSKYQSITRGVHLDKKKLEKNNRIIKDFIRKIEFKKDPDKKVHGRCQISFQKINSLLKDIHWLQAYQYKQLLDYCNNYNETKGISCWLYYMRKYKEDDSYRTLDEKNTFQLFQGKNYQGGKNDTDFKNGDISVQIHCLDLKKDDIIVERKVFYITVWFSEKLIRKLGDFNVLTQNQK